MAVCLLTFKVLKLSLEPKKKETKGNIHCRCRTRSALFTQQQSATLLVGQKKGAAPAPNGPDPIALHRVEC